MIGGLSRRGSVEEFEFWSDLGVDFIMLSVAYNFFFDEERVSDVIEYREGFGLDILIHTRPDGKTLLSPANPAAHDTMFKGLDIIEKLVKKYGLIDKLIMHPPTYRIPGSGYVEFSEEEAVVNSRPFYRKLKSFSGLTFVLENVYPPGIGWEELGYERGHFKLFDFGGDFEFCLDTGHLKLSELSVEDITNLPFELTCLHLQSNDGKTDQHIPLTRRNFSEWKQVEVLLSDDKFMVVEAKNEKEKIPYILKYLRKNQIAP